MKTLTIALAVLLSLGSLADTGKEIYDKKCAKCHGADGDGQGRAGRSLKKAPTPFNIKADMDKISDEELTKATKEGGKAVNKSEEMEAYPNYSDTEMKDLISYIRSLGK